MSSSVLFSENTSFSKACDAQNAAGFVLAYQIFQSTPRAVVKARVWLFTENQGMISRIVSANDVSVSARVCFLSLLAPGRSVFLYTSLDKESRGARGKGNFFLSESDDSGCFAGTMRGQKNALNQVLSWGAFLRYVLPESHPYPALFKAFSQYLKRVSSGDALWVRVWFSLQILKNLGYGFPGGKEEKSAQRTAAPGSYSQKWAAVLANIGFDCEVPHNRVQEFLMLLQGNFHQADKAMQSLGCVRTDLGRQQKNVGGGSSFDAENLEEKQARRSDKKRNKTRPEMTEKTTEKTQIFLNVCWHHIKKILQETFAEQLPAHPLF